MTRALAKAPADRYGSCGELVASARAALGLPDVSSPSTRPRPRRARRLTPTRWPVRVRALVGAAAAVVLLAAVAGAVLLRGPDGLTGIRPLSVGVIDPASSEIVADIPVGFESSLLAAGEGFVWVLDQKASTLTRIDPRPWKSSGPPRHSADGIPIALAVGEGSVWVAVERGAHSRRDRDRTGARRIPRPHCSPDDSDGHVLGLARGSRPRSGGARRLGARTSQGEVTRIDPQTGRPKRLAENLGASSSIAAGGGAVWLGGINGVSKLDPATGAELGSTFVDGVLASETTAIAVGTDSVWFTGSSSAKLWQIQSGGETVLDSFPVGAGPSAVAVGAGGTVWVANSADESVSRVESGDDSSQRIELGASPGGIVTAFGRVWTSPHNPLR